MYENIVDKDGNKFYNVKKSSIIQAQKDIGVFFPEDLIRFYGEVGYGFLKSKVDFFNRIMDPDSIREFRLREGQFANNSELEVYADSERDKLVFFEVCEGYYLSIGISKRNKGEIYSGKKMIAKNFKEFLIKYQEDERYF